VAKDEIDIFDPKGKDKVACFTPQERESFSKFLEKGFVDTFRQLYPEKKQFSYFSARSNAKAEDKGWRIDYFVVSKEHIGMVVDSSIHKEYAGSDHVPIQLKLKLANHKDSEETKEEASLNSKKRAKSVKSPAKVCVAKESVSRHPAKSAARPAPARKPDETESEEEEVMLTRVAPVTMICEPKKVLPQKKTALKSGKKAAVKE